MKLFTEIQVLVVIVVVGRAGRGSSDAAGGTQAEGDQLRHR